MKVVAKIALYVLGGFAALVAVAGVVLLAVDWNVLRSTINERASAATGRGVEIKGDLTAAWSLRPSVVAHDVVFANAEWGSQPEMLRIEELYVKFRILPLLVGRIEIDQLRLVRPRLLLEAKGEQANWRLRTETPSAAAVEAALPKERSQFPILRDLSVEDGVITYKSDRTQEKLEVGFAKLELEAGGTANPVRVKAEGTFKKRPFTLQANLGSLDQLRDKGEPFPLKLSANIGDTKATVEGQMSEPVEFRGLDAQVAIEGKSLADIRELFGVPLPASDAFAIAGHLRQGDDDVQLRGFTGHLGNSDLRGDLSISSSGSRPRVVGDLQSRSLDLSDIEGLWGGNPEKDQAKRLNQAAKREDAPREAADHIIPDRPFKLPALNRMDADLRFRGETVTSGALEVRSISWHLLLADGVVKLEPLELGLAGGRIRANIQLDGRKEEPTASLDVRIQGMQLNALLALLGQQGESFGELSGNMRIDSHGRSMREVAAHVNGQGLLMMSGGKIRNIVLEAIALDLQEALEQWIADDKTMVDIDCLVMPIPIHEGRLVANPWLLDTSDTFAVIRGYLDLGQEKVALKLEPQPKDFSLFNTLSSIEIEGDLAKRKTEVNKLELIGKLALKALAAPLMPILSESIQEAAKSRSPCSGIFAEIGSPENAAKMPPANADGASPPARQSAATTTPPGRLVASVQRALSQRGYVLAVDGILGPSTEQMIRRFQLDNGLRPTGGLDEDTLAQLGLYRSQ